MRAPIVVTDEMVAGMKPGAVIVDVAVDQGGCIATTHETTHTDPVYERHGVLHYAVGNMPGAGPFTSTYGLTSEDAYLLSSLVVDLRISEIVDAGQYVVSALLPEAVFSER